MKIHTMSRIVAECARFINPQEIVFSPSAVPLGDGRVLCFQREQAWGLDVSRDDLEEIRTLEHYAFQIEDYDSNPIREGLVVVYSHHEDREIRVTLEEFAGLRNMSFREWRESIPTRYADRLYAVSGKFLDGTSFARELDKTLIVRGRKPVDACRRAVSQVARSSDIADVKVSKKRGSGRRYEVREVPNGCVPEDSGKCDLSGVYYCRVYDDHSDSWK